MRLTVLLSLWDGWAPMYSEVHALAMSRMLRKHLRMPHQIVLLTDRWWLKPEDVGVDRICEIPPDPNGLQLRTRWNCFRRLRFFDPSYTKQFGTEWVMSIDLDTLILGDITDMIESHMTDFGFAALRGRETLKEAVQRPYNGALFMVRVGDHAHVWSEFDGKEGPLACAESGWVGTDQVWMCLKIQGAPTIGHEHGMYYLGEIADLEEGDVPPKVVNYAGHKKPWSKMVKRSHPALWKEYQQHV